VHPFRLAPFPPAPAGLALTGEIARSGGGLRAAYRLDDARAAGPDVIDVIDVAAAPARRDGLWRDTCVELFFGRPGDPAYIEVNLSPSGDWNAYAFSGYRAGMTPIAGARLHAETARRGPDGALELGFTLTLDEELPPALEAGVSAVLAHAGGGRSYWALAHPGERPDFHDRGGFRLRL
jgi:hypothetical protein